MGCVAVEVEVAVDEVAVEVAVGPMLP